MIEETMSPVVMIILIVIFSMIFMRLFLLFKNRSKLVRTIEKKIKPISGILFSDAIIKIFCTWSFIQFFKKFLYFIPLHGIMQTKSSIWWVDNKTLGLILYILLIYIFGIWVKGYLDKNSGLNLRNGAVWISVYGIVIFCIVVPVLLWQNIDGLSFYHFFVLVLLTPLILIKMVYTGKIFGMITALLTGIIVAVYSKKKFKPVSLKQKKVRRISYTTFIILMIFILFNVSHGDFDVKFWENAIGAKNNQEIEDVVDAAYSLTSHKFRTEGLRNAAFAMAKAGKFLIAFPLAVSIPDRKIRIDTINELNKNEIKNVSIFY